MLCTQYQLRKQEQIGTSVRLLPCRSWGCEYCAPNRQRQLRAIAASGAPNICLTLTVNPEIAETVVDRYKRLHDAWKKLVKRILRQLKLPPSERWFLRTDEGHYYQDTIARQITEQTAAGEITRLHYMAFCEETAKGEPHLHILLRCKYIPQRWIAQQMQDMINSPIVWIEKIKGTKAAIAYVSKYLTKAPAQFGKSRRYWCSRFYQINSPDREEIPVFDRATTVLLQVGMAEFVREIVIKGLSPIVTAKRELLLLRGVDIPVYKRSLPPGTAAAQLAASWVWLQGWRGLCRV